MLQQPTGKYKQLKNDKQEQLQITDEVSGTLASFYFSIQWIESNGNSITLVMVALFISYLIDYLITNTTWNLIAVGASVPVIVAITYGLYYLVDWRLWVYLQQQYPEATDIQLLHLLGMNRLRYSQTNVLNGNANTFFPLTHSSVTSAREIYTKQLKDTKRRVVK